MQKATKHKGISGIDPETFMIPDMISMPRYGQKYIWVNRFNEESAREVTEQLFELDAARETKVIPIYIDSYGGEVDSLMTILNAMTVCQKPIATIAIGKAISAGALLLSQGTPNYRFAGEHSRIMVHETMGGAIGKLNDIAIESAEHKRINDEFLTLFANRTKFKTLKTLKKFLLERGNADWYLTPQDALQWGIIDCINIPFLVQTEPRLEFAVPMTSEQQKEEEESMKQFLKMEKEFQKKQKQSKKTIDKVSTENKADSKKSRGSKLQ